jgi:hypothetical protein
VVVPRHLEGGDQEDGCLRPARHHLNKKAGVMVHICHSSYVRGISRRVSVQAVPGKK